MLKNVMQRWGKLCALLGKDWGDALGEMSAISEAWRYEPPREKKIPHDCCSEAAAGERKRKIRSLYPN